MISTKESTRELLGLDKVNQVDYVGITVASPDAIRSWSKGEVKNPVGVSVLAQLKTSISSVDVNFMFI